MRQPPSDSSPSDSDSLKQELHSANQLNTLLSEQVLYLEKLLVDNGIDVPKSTLIQSSRPSSTSKPVTNSDLLITITSLRSLSASQSQLISEQSSMLHNIVNQSLDAESSTSIEQILSVVQQENQLLRNEVTTLRSNFESEVAICTTSLHQFKNLLSQAKSRISELESELEQTQNRNIEIEQVIESLSTQFSKLSTKSINYDDWKRRALIAEQSIIEQNEEFSQKAQEFTEMHAEMQSNLIKAQKERDELWEIVQKYQSNMANEAQSSSRNSQLLIELEETNFNFRKTWTELTRAVKLLTEEEERSKSLSRQLKSSRAALSLSTRLLSLHPNDGALVLQAVVVLCLFEVGKQLLNQKPELQRVSSTSSQSSSTQSSSIQSDGKFDSKRIERLAERRRGKE
ncbi:hypothetical protein RCL1_004356 [Eukaryota sp. TZLM3-RCL]